METVAFQGEPGAYSHLACTRVLPNYRVLPCPSFRAALLAVSTGEASVAMVPTENSVAGRVADIHRLLPEAELHIIGEHFQPIHHVLMGAKESSLASIKDVKSHPQALAQCRKTLETMKLNPVTHSDTAGAARELAQTKDPKTAVIASELAAQTYGLSVLQTGMQDKSHNMTRFLLLSRTPLPAHYDPECSYVTSIVFHLRSVPAALYKALGGFATNGINLTKIESYLDGGSFEAARFYVDAESHTEGEAMKLALEELDFYCEKGGIQILGTYPSHPLRRSRMA